jgi:hypothetical protein
MNNQFFYPSVVLDDKDPLMLGRVRARVLTDNYDDIVSSITNPVWDENTDKWGDRDPFIFLPLLPYFIYQVPKKDELIYAFYYNSEYRFQNQFYVQASFSSPTLSPKEYYVGAQKNTGVGGQFKNPIPLKNQDGSYSSPENKGVFPEPGDNAILGRGSADLIVKEDEVLLRAGKVIGNILPNVIPAANNTRAYLQLSKFNNIKIPQGIVTYNEEKEVVVLVKYLIEWVITNPENTQDKFTGSVYIYKLKPNIKTNSKELQVDSKIEQFKTLISVSNFQALSLTDTTIFINNFIKKCNNEEKIEGKVVFNGSPFPIYYRPTNEMYSLIISQPTTINSQITISNLNKIFKKIKLNTNSFSSGYGLIYKKDSDEYPYETTETSVLSEKYGNKSVTFASMGGDKMALLSHLSSIPGKNKINFDGTLYGISNDVFTDEIVPNTSSMVRGEELIELLNLIVRFLITHTHAYPGLPPVPVTQDGSNVTSILTEMQNAVNKILNENIRIN